MNLTINMMLNLKKYGFEFEEFEHYYNIGMVYYYDHREYFIGGIVDFNETFPIMGDEGTPDAGDQSIAEKGIWLPNEGDLMLWLQRKWNYNITIRYVDDEQYYYGIADDGKSESIHGSGPDLLCCLYKLVLKVCKRHHIENNKIP